MRRVGSAQEDGGAPLDVAENGRAPEPVRLLVVDDEDHVRTMLVRTLIGLGYDARGAACSHEALAALRDAPFDVALLDLRLPDFDGIDLMGQIREERPGVLVIILTGHASLESTIAALRMGAVDYLLKPVSIQGIEEALVRALGERGRGRVSPRSVADENALLHVGPVALHQEKYLASLTGDGTKAVQLTPSEAALLGCLMRRAGQAVSCQRLARNALGYEMGEAEAVSIVRPHISRLRHKMEAAPGSPHLIETVPGKGYRFAADVSR